MDVLLVRHAPAARRDPGEWPDDDLRPLTAKGRKAFARAAKGTAAAATETRLVLTSPALRSRETADILAAALGLPRRKVRSVPFLHHAVTPRAALAGLAALELPPAFALVGHEPNLGELTSLLIAGDVRARLPLRKGAACLIAAEALAPGAGSLRWSLPPDLLAELGRS